MMIGRIHKDELPSYWELSPDAQWQAYKDQQKSDRRKVASWILPIVVCLPAIAFMTLKPVNDGVSLVANALSLMAMWQASRLQIRRSPQSNSGDR